MAIDERAGARREKLLYGFREPARPIPAATVMLVRDGASGLELLMTRRSTRASFAPGVYVFPGGTVDAADHALAERALTDHARLAEHVQQASRSPHDTAFAVAAIRESFEELGLLLARDQTGAWVTSTTTSAMDRSPSAGFAAQLATHGLIPALDALFWFSHWVTDRDLPRRFDTRFFVAVMPPGQSPVADESEQFEPIWIHPQEALSRHDAGTFDLIFPTIRTLRQLQAFPSVAALLGHARMLDEPARDVRFRRYRSSPRAGMLRGAVARFAEEESPYGELELVSPDGSIHHTLDWQHEPVRLLHHVTRITAPNPGRMTGPGTNTYVIGEKDSFVVIDPGPDSPEHLQRIAAITGKNLRAIVCTHSHPDHYPGAAPLRALLDMPDVPILGMRAGPHFNPAWAFEPDAQVRDNELLHCGDSTLRMLFTPGHASNHVCLLLEEDGLLFSGDHILNGSTTVIDHPDGDMSAYMQSLSRLRDEPVRFILPAHGHVLADPVGQIDALIAHRLRREAKILACVRDSGGGDVDALVRLAYDDVDPMLHPVAKRSLTAHLVKLAADKLVSQHDEQWAPSAVV